MTDKRLIEVAFPLKQASIDSVREKTGHKGHPSTLHTWPARRPLAASRAALIATLLPDPGSDEKRKEMIERLGGKLVKTVKKKKRSDGNVEEVDSWETEGGVLRWGRESSPEMDRFREEIRKSYGDRAPKMLDPFSGGGAIPLEAMRLGCEVTAADINPVAWFILKCTLEYPQRLAGQIKKLPDFALADTDFMAEYLEARGLKLAEPSRRRKRSNGSRQGSSKSAEGQETLDLLSQENDNLSSDALNANFAWHLRAWARRVLKKARKELARFYPLYAEYCTLEPYRVATHPKGESFKLIPLDDEGEPRLDLLNFSGGGGGGVEDLHQDASDNLSIHPSKPRWIPKPVIAYLWARTVRCKSCRAIVPLLKTCWIVKKDSKKVLLVLNPLADGSGVEFYIDIDADSGRPDTGTMSRAGVTCPCCRTIMTMEDLRVEGRGGRLGTVMTAVVVDGYKGKEYRLPTPHEIEIAEKASSELDRVFAEVPFGLPSEAMAGIGTLGFRVPLYGLNQWKDLFTPRQLLALGTLVKASRDSLTEISDIYAEEEWREAIFGFLAIVLDKTADRSSSICRWLSSGESTTGMFARFTLSMVWDFAEIPVIKEAGGGWLAQSEWIARYLEHGLDATKHGSVRVLKQSAIEVPAHEVDIIVTDPPYYDAIPYSDLMDFFYVWLRRTLNGLSPEIDAVFSESSGPKWNHEANDGELIDDASRFDKDREKSKKNYEAGMARAFSACYQALRPDGRLVIVFAHKHPDAWETLVSAVIKAGFTVTGSWPIQTEMNSRMRAISSAALASSIWLVCRKRDPKAKAGWDKPVIEEMQSNIVRCLRDFWDAGIRGPDFVWSATGPALEAYSRYPAVKKASEPGQLMEVDEFLRQVRRIVVDFVVGNVLSPEGESSVGDHSLDDITTYYLLHRNDFGFEGAQAGACILYMVSCNLLDRELTDTHGLLVKGGRSGKPRSDDDSDAAGEEGGQSVASGGNEFRLKAWSARSSQSLGEESAAGRVVPMIDQVHKLMHLWKAGNVVKVDDYLDRHSLRRSQIFSRLIQALIEQSRRDSKNSDERSILERLANHLKSVGSTSQPGLDLEG